MEEQAEIGYRFLRDGELQFFSLIDKNERQSGDILLRESFAQPEQISSFARTLPVNHQYAYGLTTGAVVVEPKFSVTFPQTVATAVTDRVERVITPRIEVKNNGEPLLIDEQQRALQKLAYETDGEGMLFAAAVEQNTLLITHFVTEENFMTGAVTLTPNYTEIPLNSAIDNIVVTPDLRQVLVRRGTVHVFDISISGTASERELLPMRTCELGAQPACICWPALRRFCSRMTVVKYHSGSKYRVMRVVSINTSVALMQAHRSPVSKWNIIAVPSTPCQKTAT